MLMPGAVWYRNNGIQSGTEMLRYRTEMSDAGMPMPVALVSMPMPSYGRNTSLYCVHSNKMHEPCKKQKVHAVFLLVITVRVIHDGQWGWKLTWAEFPCPEAEFMNAQFRWGFRGGGVEWNPLVEVTVNSKEEKTVRLLSQLRPRIRPLYSEGIYNKDIHYSFFLRGAGIIFTPEPVFKTKKCGKESPHWVDSA
jgi:hypothetical protein